MDFTESDLIRAARGGDREAFLRLYEKHQPSVYTFICYRVNDPALAEDLTAEVFVRMVVRLESHFTDRGKPILAWLYTIARNLITDHHRRHDRIIQVPLDEGLESADTDPPGEIAENSILHANLAHALRKLTEDQRQVILLKFVEGRSNAEVAAVLGKNEGSVKSLQHRALAALRSALDGEQVR